MGTEGWNCPSLFACALIRKLTASNNFILQAASRCLRQVPDNALPARVYLTRDNLELVETFICGGLDRFERVMAEHGDRPEPYKPSYRVKLPGHQVDELEHWYCFKTPEQRRPKTPDRPPVVHRVPVRAVTKVRRNDPCPCGSGKKYNKCCGG